MHEVNDSGSLGISILFFTFDGDLAQIMFSSSKAVGYMPNECWYYLQIIRPKKKNTLILPKTLYIACDLQRIQTYS